MDITEIKRKYFTDYKNAPKICCLLNNPDIPHTPRNPPILYLGAGCSQLWG